MNVELDLRIQERRDDRVIVSLRMRPSCGSELVEGGAAVDGAALSLVDRGGDEVCPQVLVPLSGPIGGPVSVNVELRANRRLPEGCRVIALVWRGADQANATCPADPDVSLASYMCGSRHRVPSEDAVDLFTLDDADRVRLEAIWPWVACPIRPVDGSSVLDAGSANPDALVDELGLDEDSAEWLHELLHEADS